ncbi:T9SS type A sorting domain-containing protein [Algibacter sp. 2305UL17-15]|uniref:T9SS type A sorting domain-containing protein n=1 Tax=Algibacter sp. 2305UL17-15 TaxID=3231268 RepID=UPI003458FC03
MKYFLLLVVFISIPLLSNSQPPEPPTGFRWVLYDLYSDEFNGTALDITKWKNSFTGWQGRVPAKFEPTAVSVQGGNMQIKSGKYATPQGAYTMYGGAVTSLKETAYFGYYECRFKTSKIPMSTTFWLSNSKQDYTPTPCATDRYSQELDIVEAVGEPHGNVGFKQRMKSNTHHRYVACGASEETFYSNGTESELLSSEVWEDYHTYGMQWHDTQSATFYSDGRLGDTVLFNTTIDANPFDRPMFMAMVTETYDWLTPYPTDSELNNDAINTAYYDWVRSYRLVPIFDPEPVNAADGLENADFEFGNLTNWTGWGGTIRTVSTTDPYEGTYAAHIKGAGAHERIVTLKPNTTYLLKSYIKVLGGKMIFGAKENNVAGTVLGVTNNITNPTYQQTVVEFTTGTETNIKFYFFAQTTNDEAYGDNFEIIEKNPPAKASVFTEDINFNSTPILSNATQTLTVSYNYKANLNRDIKFHVFDSGSNEVYSTTIDGLEGYGNHEVTLSLGSTLPNGSYTVVADLRPQGGSDAQVIDTVTSSQLTLSVANFEKEDFKIQLYPNPATNLVHIKTEALQGKTKVYMYDILGQLVLKTEFETHKFDLDLSSIPNKGMYFVVLRNNEKISSKKLVVN